MISFLPCSLGLKTRTAELDGIRQAEGQLLVLFSKRPQMPVPVTAQLTSSLCTSPLCDLYCLRWALIHRSPYCRLQVQVLVKL